MKEEKHFLCIDLKSFFASCECIERGLDPFTTPLVVANKNQGSGAITLAVTPFLKKQGIKGRTRLYEIPKNIPYQIVNPRMNLYLKKSSEVVAIYLDFVAEEDLHIYSIDECFLDVTHYLTLYKKTDVELGLEILETIRKKTGLQATCGIGSNMLLAKLSMDIEAKNTEGNIAKWTKEDVETKLWPITPLSKMWGIGTHLEKRLQALSIYTIGDLAHFSRTKLKEKFGVMGLELWNHANGIDTSCIQDFKKIKKEKSFSHSQVLFKDYFLNARLIIQEMTGVIVKRMRENHYDTGLVGLGLTYSKELHDGFYHQLKLEVPTDDEDIILKNILNLFDRYYTNLPIRKISLSCGALQTHVGTQLNLFEDYEETVKKKHYADTLYKIQNKFGKNSVLKASSLLADSTIKARNKMVGGHHE